MHPLYEAQNYISHGCYPRSPTTKTRNVYAESDIGGLPALPGAMAPDHPNHPSTPRANQYGNKAYPWTPEISSS